MMSENLQEWWSRGWGACITPMVNTIVQVRAWGYKYTGKPWNIGKTDLANASRTSNDMGTSICEGLSHEIWTMNDGTRSEVTSESRTLDVSAALHAGVGPPIESSSLHDVTRRWDYAAAGVTRMNGVKLRLITTGRGRDLDKLTFWAVQTKVSYPSWLAHTGALIFFRIHYCRSSVRH